MRLAGHFARSNDQYKLLMQDPEDERNDVFADIVTGLAQGGRAELHTWMRDFNSGRG